MTTAVLGDEVPSSRELSDEASFGLLEAIFGNIVARFGCANRAELQNSDELVVDWAM